MQINPPECHAGMSWSLAAVSAAVPTNSAPVVQISEDTSNNRKLGVKCSVNAEGTITDVSSTCITLIGYAKKELIGRKITEFLVGDATAFKRALGETVRENVVLRVETVMKHKFGPSIYVQWSGCFSPGDNAVFCILNNVTEERELERLNEKRMAMLAHDLRAPLSSLGVTLTVLEAGSFGELTETGRTTVERAQNALSRAVSLINNMLHLERLGAGASSLDCRAVRFELICKMAVQSLYTVAERAQIVIEVQGGDIDVYCDANQLARVVTNLVSNAIKFSPPHTRIIVLAKRVDDCIEISVQDQGRGVAEDKQKVIFERFKQVSAEDAMLSGGSGLGLAICKSIVEAHGGSLGVKSKPGTGSTFWCRLPSSFNL